MNLCKDCKWSRQVKRSLLDRFFNMEKALEWQCDSPVRHNADYHVAVTGKRQIIYCCSERQWPSHGPLHTCGQEGVNFEPK